MQEQSFKTDRTQILLRSLFQSGNVSHCFRNLHALPFSEKQNGAERGSNKMDQKLPDMNQCKIPAYHTAGDSAIRIMAQFRIKLSSFVFVS